MWHYGLKNRFIIDDTNIISIQRKDASTQTLFEIESMDLIVEFLNINLKSFQSFVKEKCSGGYSNLRESKNPTKTTPKAFTSPSGSYSNQMPKRGTTVSSEVVNTTHKLSMTVPKTYPPYAIKSNLKYMDELKDVLKKKAPIQPIDL